MEPRLPVNVGREIGLVQMRAGVGGYQAVDTLLGKADELVLQRLFCGPRQ